MQNNSCYPKIISECLLGISSVLGLHAAKSDYANPLLNAAEIFTKLISFADLTDISYGNKSFIAAAGIALGTVVDDIMIQQGFYNKHHLSKVGCALYAGYKMSDKQDISQFLNGAQLMKFQYGNSLTLGAGLFTLSTVLGSGDIINSMRVSTKECIEFSEKVSDLTSVDPLIDIQIGAAVNTIIGGGRQFAVDNDIDIGGPLSDTVKAAVSTGVNILSAFKSKSEFKKQLIAKFSSVDEMTINALERDPRAYKTMQNIVDNIEKASSGITNHAVNYGIKNSWQQTLAGQKGDIGLNAFVATSLFNNFKEKKVKNTKQSVKSKDLSSIKSQLLDYENKNLYSFSDEIVGCGKKVFGFLATPFIASMLVSGMSECKTDFWKPETFKKYFFPVTSTLGMSISIDCAPSTEALDDLMYLANKIYEIHHEHY